MTTVRTQAARRVQGERWPALMTLATLAAYLDRTETVIQTAVATGELPLSFTFGGKEMRSKAAVDEAIAQSDGRAPRDWRTEQPGLQNRV